MKMPLKQLVETADYVVIDGHTEIRWGSSLIDNPGSEDINLLMAQCMFSKSSHVRNTLYFLADQLVELSEKGECDLQGTEAASQFTTPFPTAMGIYRFQFGLYVPLTMVEAFKRIHLNVQ